MHQRNRKNTVAPDNPTALGSVYPSKIAGLSDVLKCQVGLILRLFFREDVFMAWKFTYRIG